MIEQWTGNPIFGEGGNVRQSVHHNLVTLKNLRYPEVRANIPPLQSALEAWKDQSDTSLLFTRILALPRAHAPMEFVTRVYENLSENDLPFMIADHEPSFSAEENIAALAGRQEEIQAKLGINSLPQILKTISVEFPVDEGRLIVLVSGVGDFRLEKRTKREIAGVLELSPKSAKRARINPPDFDTTLWVGLIPGMLKPVIQPHLVGNVDGITYMHLARPDDFVVLSVSPIDSMIIPVDRFEQHLRAYAKACYTGFEFHETPELEIWKKPRGNS